jgi:aspartate kinase
MVNICGAQMIGRPGVAKAIFSQLADRDVNVMMISQGSSEANITLVVEESQEETARDALSVLVRQGMVRQVTTNRDVCAVAVVGSDAGAKGPRRIFSGARQRWSNVMMISRSSESTSRCGQARTAPGPCASFRTNSTFRGGQ